MGGAASAEDIVLSTTVSTNMYVRGAVRVVMARFSTEGTVDWFCNIWQDVQNASNFDTDGGGDGIYG